MTEINQESEKNIHELSAEDRFEQVTSIGDLSFFTKWWPSWLINPEIKGIAPVVRVFLGDSKGQVIFSRSITLGGIIDLSRDFARIAESEAQSIKSMEGFHIYIPETKEELIAALDEIVENCSSIKNTILNIEVRGPNSDTNNQ